MKIYIAIFFQILVLQSFAQYPSVSGRLYFTQSKTEYVQVTDFTDGVVNDTLRGFIDTDGKKYQLRDLNTSLFTTQSARILTNGSDMTDRINYILSKPYVSGLILNNVNGGVIVANDSVRIPAGKKIVGQGGTTIGGTAKITGGGMIEADIYTRIFESSVKLFNVTSATGSISVAWWNGVDYTGSADATTTLKNIFATPSENTIYFPTGDYKSSDSLRLNSSLNLSMDGVLRPTVTDRAALIVGGADKKTYVVNLIRSSQSEWNVADSNNVGVVFENVTHAQFINIKESSQFNVGAKFFGNGAGTAYNHNIVLGKLFNNRVDVWIAASAGGWTNENTFMGGAFRTYTNVNPTKSKIGILIGNSDYMNNKNVFKTPTFEFPSNSGLRGIPVVIAAGRLNRVEDIRIEQTSDTTMWVKNFAGSAMANSNNFVSVLYGCGNLIDESSNGTNIRECAAVEYLKTNGRTIIQYNNIVNRTAYMSNGNVTLSGGSFLCTSTAGTPAASVSDVSIAGDYIELGAARAIGTTIDARWQKRFVVRKDVVQGYGGRVYVKQYNADGSIIGDDIRPKSNSDIRWTSGFGGVWMTEQDYDGEVSLNVSDTVKKVVIYLANGTNNLRIKSFTITSRDEGSGTIIPTLGIEESQYNYIDTPVIGTYKSGRIVYKTSPTEGGTIGWRFTSDGTFGTLSGLTGSITNGTNALTMSGSGADNISIGVYLNINGNPIRVIGKSGSIVYLEKNATATLTNAAIQYYPPAFIGIGGGNQINITGGGGILIDNF